MDKYAILRLSVDRSGTVAEVTGFLNALQDAFEGLLVLDFVTAKSNKFSKEYWAHSWQRLPATSEILYPSEALRLHVVELRSPGFWEFLGALNPLETIRKYLQDRDERRIKSGREPFELEKRGIENDEARLNLFEKKIRALRKLGYSDAEIRRLINGYALKPISRLEEFQDSGLLIGAELNPKGVSKVESNAEGAPRVDRRLRHGKRLPQRTKDKDNGWRL